MESTYFYEGPIGQYCLCETDGKLTRLWLGNRISMATPGKNIEETPLLREAHKQLNAYFNRELQTFDLPLFPQGTDFQLKVWNLLRDIPYGTTITYGEMARRTGDPKACRAVGSANGHNPLPIFIPCHRIMGAGGKLTGYTGGLDIKIKLLQIERIYLG